MKRGYGFSALLFFVMQAQSADQISAEPVRSSGAAISVSTSATETSAQRSLAQPPLTQQSSARLWGLSTEEWTRYEQLKRAERGIWSPALDPLTTLGVEATTDRERRRYARLLVEKEALRVEKELAFQRAYDDAWRERFPDTVPVADFSAAPLSVAGTARLAVFVRQHCIPCDVRLKTLLASAHPLDIYLVDSQGDDRLLRRAALGWQIDSARVQRQEITLNHDGGRWRHYGQGRMPAVLVKQGDTWLPVATP